MAKCNMCDHECHCNKIWSRCVEKGCNCSSCYCGGGDGGESDKKNKNKKYATKRTDVHTGG